MSESTNLRPSLASHRSELQAPRDMCMSSIYVLPTCAEAHIIAAEVSDMTDNKALVTRTVDPTRSNQTEHSRRWSMCLVLCLGLCAAVLLTGSVVARGQTESRPQPQAPPTPSDIKPGSITLEDLPYPYPVSYLPITQQMTYLDPVVYDWAHYLFHYCDALNFDPRV